MLGHLDQSVVLNGPAVGRDNEKHTAHVLAHGASRRLVRRKAIKGPTVVGHLGGAVLALDGPYSRLDTLTGYRITPGHQRGPRRCTSLGAVGNTALVIGGQVQCAVAGVRQDDTQIWALYSPNRCCYR